MTRTCYDSINPASIPTTAAIVAGYIDGLFGPDHKALGSATGWDALSWSRFPNAVLVRIACFASTNDGHVLDVEQGNATPSEAPGWVLMRRAKGIDPTVYCSYDTWATVEAAFNSAKVAQPHYWIADYDNVPTIFAGAIAKQYANATYTKANYDLSIVADYWPGVDMDPYLQAQLTYLACYGRVYSGTEAQWLIDIYSGKTPTNDLVGDTIGHLISTPEGVAWAAKEAQLRSGGAVGPQGPQGIQGTTGPAGPPGPAGVSPDPNTVTTSVLQRILDSIKNALGL